MIPNVQNISILPERCADALGLPGAILIGVAEGGEIVIHSHGIRSHAEAVRCLAVGIHAVMSQHDEAVRGGAAGPEAQRRACELSGTDQ